MRFVHTVSQHRFLSFVIGTIVLQAVILSAAAYLRSNSAKNSEYTLALSEPRSISEERAERAAPDAKEVPAAEPLQDSSPTEHKPREITYRVASGDTLTKIWTDHGGTVAGAVKAAEAFKSVDVPLKSLRLNDEIFLVLSPEGDIIEFRKKLPDGKRIVLEGSSETGYEATIIKEKVIVQEKTVSYPIFSSFSVAANEASVPNEIIDDLVDLFSGRLDFRREVQPGDSFTVIYTERTTESGEVLAPGEIRAISIENNGKLMVAVRHEGKDGKARFFDENGALIGDYFLRYPLKFTRISSVFSKSRFHPILKISRPHNGVDFAAPSGTPVRAVADGVIESAGFSNGTGNMVKIRHDSRYSTAYLHLSKISSGLKPGRHVSRGEVIGGVGMTGLATAPHLHYTLYDNGKFIDPMTSKLPTAPPSGNTIPKTYLASTVTFLKQQHDMVRIATKFGLGRIKA